MIVFSGNKLYKEFFDEESDNFVREEFSADDSLLHFYKDPVIFEENTTLENVFWAFLNDSNSEELFGSLKRVSNGDNLYSFFRDRLKLGSEAILRNNIDWIEFSPLPVVGFHESQDRNMLDVRSFKIHEEEWNLVGWNVNDDEDVESINLSSFSLEKLLDIPIELDKKIPVYDDDWNCKGFYEDVPSVSDILECLCHEFYYYREVSRNTEKDEMISLIDLLERRKN